MNIFWGREDFPYGARDIRALSQKRKIEVPNLKRKICPGPQTTPVIAPPQLEVLDKRFAKQYDYVYLPVDFVNHCNVGYAFINLRSPETRASGGEK